ncbi:MAG: glycosyltransferase family 2 protein [Gemmatimonadota bacterium]|nr:MAG: glycosyltransferase family 2 protein [Gemmatimonadota bacterium]
MNEAGDVSAVVVNHNGGQRVLRCLHALSDQEPRFAEIIVVDNASVDDSARSIAESFPAVRIERLSENRGPSPARNAGLRLADSPLVLLIDDDVYLERGGLAKLLDRFRSDGPALVCPRVVYYPGPEIIQCDGADAHFLGTMRLRHGELPLAAAPQAAAEVGSAISACLLLQREVALEAGGFDEDYFIYVEDHEFAYRLRALGHRILCEPAAVALHDRRSGVPGLSYRGEAAYPARRFYLTTRNRLTTVLIHYRLRTLIVALPALAAHELAASVIALARGWLRHWLRAWVWQFKTRKAIARKRSRIQTLRVVRDRSLLSGGPIPMAPGFIRSPVLRGLAAFFSAGLNGYWRLTRRLIG